MPRSKKRYRSNERPSRSKERFLSATLITAITILGYCVVSMFSDIPLFLHGVTTHGVIVGVGTGSCGKHSSGPVYQIQFTDQKGQTQVSTISQCSDTPASPGDPFTIVYLPDDPAQIARPDQLLNVVRFDVFMSILTGLITLILLPLWIRKQMREPSLQAKLAAAASYLRGLFSSRSHY